MNKPAMSTVDNPFLTKSILSLYLKTALPIIIILIVNGIYNLINAWFVGNYVGTLALTAVAIVFPLQMLIFALATLISSGMSSILARRLGARDLDGASQVFTSALWLALLTFMLTAILFRWQGIGLIKQISGNLPLITTLATSYISILIYGAPILGLLVVNIDALRSEGKIKFMSSCMLLSALLNILLDYVLIVRLEQGVIATAYATLTAQIISLMLIIIYRLRGKSNLRIRFGGFSMLRKHAITIIPLGLPLCLSHMGVALQIGLVNQVLKTWAWDDYATLAGAFGIVTRIMTFAILPLIGLNISFQTILGNNFGANISRRANETIKIGILIVSAYCVVILFAFTIGAEHIGTVFVNDTSMSNQVVHLMRIIVSTFVLFGVSVMISGYFQAIGRPKYAILLGIAKNYIFIWPIILLLPLMQGEAGIWYAFPLSDILTMLLLLAVLYRNARNSGARFGLLFSVGK